MKKLVLLIFTLLSVSVLFASCKSQKSKKIEKNIKTEKQIDEEVVQKIDPQIAKLNKVLLSMTDRCKQEMANGDPYEFLADLQKVLDAEKSFPQDDISLYYLIDKKHNISSDYEPTNLVKLVKNEDYIINKTTLSLRKDVEAALRVMAQAAKEDGIMLDVSSTYRSYATQERTFNYWVSVDGLEEAERESARPGTSQHQLGVAIDFGNIEDSFALTDSSKWLVENAAKYGWSLSFPQGYEDVTGYRYESWHYRYIGVEACAFQKKWFNDIQQYMFEFIDAWKKEL